MHRGDKIRKGNFQEHVINKSMWKGAAQLTKLKSWKLNNGKFIPDEIYYSPAALKIYDELVVNISDHWYETQNDKYKVTFIQILFDKKCGHLTIYNTGSGFPVRKMNDGTWLPQAVVSMEFTGSNLDVNEDRVVGGTNGLGMKITSILSQAYAIETVDPYTGQYYFQEFHNNIKDISTPEILPLTDKSLSDAEKIPHTQIDLDPDYAKLGYNTGYSEKVGENLEQEFILRLYQISAFIRCMGGKCKIKYNDKQIDVNLKQFAEMFPVEDVVEIDMPHEKFPWKLAICVKSDARFESHSVINGIYARDGGHHINHLCREIYRGLSSKVEKILRDYGIEPNPDKKKHDNDLQHYVMDHIFLFMFGQIGDPQWPSQSKEKLIMKQSSLKERKLSDKDINKIWKIVKPYIELSIAERRGNRKRPKGKLNLKKYQKAKNAKSGSKHKCYLFIPEGDSAQLLIEGMFKAKGSKISSNFYGIYNIGGVPVNVRKKIRNVKAGGKSVRIISDKLDENEKFQGLMDVIGLDYDKTYKSDTEFNKLKYKHIIIAVDQDHDGVGQINGLLVNMFATLWPELIKRGFILRWESPIMRAFSKRKIGKGIKVLDFYSEEEYESWKKDQGNVSSQWKIKYYKGLSAHQPAEAVQLAKTFDSHLIKQQWDDLANQSFEIFYGQDTDERKRELCTPVIKPIREDILKYIDCTYLLKYHVKLFQLSVINRKVPNVHDGLASVHRKILAGSRLVPTKTMKVFQLGGLIAEKMNYHHGEMSINKAIAYMCQCFTGAKNMPLLQGLGQFGSIQKGTKKSGSPRYTSVKLNKKLTDILFPSVDDWLLPYSFEDGIRCEPEYYSPIVPYSILEHFTTTSVGWKIGIYARDFKKVIANVRKMINGHIPDDMENDLWLPDKYDAAGNLISNHMELRDAYATKTASKMTPHCFGKYKYIKNLNTIHITELPIRKWVEPYTIYITEHKEKYVESVDSNLCEKPDIKIKLKPGAMTSICNEYGDDTMDPIEQYFELRQNLSPCLNFVDEYGKVLSCDSYVEVMEKWFPMRRDLYKLRLTKDIIMCELMIMYYKNLIRYWDDIDIGKIVVPKSADVSKLIENLSEHNYDKFNRTKLMNPKYTPVGELKNIVLNEDASYDYILDGCTPRYMTKAAQNKRLKELEKLENELETLKSLTWKILWENELEKLEQIVEEGTATSWLFGEASLSW